MTGVLEQPNGNFAGQRYASVVTYNYFVVSCQDCAVPGVFLFTRDLVPVQDFGMPAMVNANDTINLALYEDSRYMMQLFVANRERIDVIEMQADTKNNIFFKKTDGLYSIETPYNSSLEHEIYIGKGRNYLVFKLSSRPYLYLMATCQSDEFYDPESFTCVRCRPAHHSFGLQNEQCFPCNSLWMNSKNDELLTAIYNQRCTSGEFKSIGVIVGTIVFILLVGIICCCSNRVIEKKLRRLENQSRKI